MKKFLPALIIIGFCAIVALTNKKESKVYKALNNEECGTFTEVQLNMREKIKGVNNEEVVFGFSNIR